MEVGAGPQEAGAPSAHLLDSLRPAEIPTPNRVEARRRRSEHSRRKLLKRTCLEEPAAADGFGEESDYLLN